MTLGHPDEPGDKFFHGVAPQSLAASITGISANLLVTSPATAQSASSPEAVEPAAELASIMSKDPLAQMTNQMTAQVWPQIETKARGSVDTQTLGSCAPNSSASLLIL
jgi:hypothetical protein